jgi:hypothetical protein
MRFDPRVFPSGYEAIDFCENENMWKQKPWAGESTRRSLYRDYINPELRNGYGV